MSSRTPDEIYAEIAAIYAVRVDRDADDWRQQYLARDEREAGLWRELIAVVSLDPATPAWAYIAATVARDRAAEKASEMRHQISQLAGGTPAEGGGSDA